MVQPAYSFLDVAVLEEVRERLAAGDALVVLSRDLGEIVWANGPGAALLGYADINAALGEASNLGAVARRQVMATRGYPQIGRDRAMMVRLASGMASHPVQVLASALRLPDGEEAILLAVPFSHGASRASGESAARAIAGFAGDGQYAAIIDGQGRVEAASPGFERLGIAPVTLQAATADAVSQGGRLAKRMLNGDAPHPAGLARLTDDPARYLLVVIDERVEVEGRNDAAGAPVAAATVPDLAAATTAVSSALPVEAIAEIAQVAAPAEAEATHRDIADGSGVVPSQPGHAVPDVADTAGTGGAENVDALPHETGAADRMPAEPDLAADDSGPAPDVGDSAEAAETIDSSDAIPESRLAASGEDADAPPVGNAAPAEDLPLAEVQAAGDDRLAATPELVTTTDSAVDDAQSPGLDVAGDDEPAANAQPVAEAKRQALPTAVRGAGVDRTAAPLRFVWRTDADGRFSQISPEFGEALGAAAADVVGKPFRDVADAFGLDPEGEIAGLLERRDTWSGRSVLWPLAGTDFRVPVDLAALPVYDRNRNFEGFRGFGIARIAEAVSDARAIGLALTRAIEGDVSETMGPAAKTAEPTEPAPPAEPDTLSDKSADPFQGEVPALEIAPRPERRQSDKVIRLAEHRQNGIDKSLSPGERSAFREIGERLKSETAVPGPDPASENPAQPSAAAAPGAAVATPNPADAPTEATADARETRGDAIEAVLGEAAAIADVAAMATGAISSAEAVGAPADVSDVVEAQSAEAAVAAAAFAPIAEGTAVSTEHGAAEDATAVAESVVAEKADAIAQSDEPAIADDSAAGLPAVAAPDVAAASESGAQADQPAPRRPRKLSLLDYARDEPAADIAAAGPTAGEDSGAAQERPADVSDERPAITEHAAAGIMGAAEQPATKQTPEGPTEVHDAGDTLFSALARVDEAEATAASVDAEPTRPEPEAQAASELHAGAIESSAGTLPEVEPGDRWQTPFDAARDERPSEHEPTPPLQDPAAEPAPASPHADEGLVASRPEVDFEPRADEEPEPVHPTDTSILDRLPVPLLIHVADRLYYANPEFLALSGHTDLADLENAGGLGSLFVEPYGDEDVPGGGDHVLRLRDKAGNEHPIEAVLRSVPWNGGNALMLVVRRTNQQLAAAADALSAERESQLKARVVEMRTIIDTATDGVVLIGRDGTIRSISRPAEAMFGFDSEDVVGKPFASLFAPESQRSANDYLNGLLDNGVASVLNDGREVIGREAQGRFIPIFMTMGRLPGDTGFCAVLRDITQWKRAEEELTQARAQAEQASSLKTDFLARVSHEIRTPLNAIIGFSELMVDEKFGPVGNDRYRDYLRDINRSGSLVLDLVNDLLDISKIEAGQQEMSYEAVSLNDTLAETVALMQPQANRERVIIRSSFASRLPEVVADLRSIRQIALNILSNAIRYTPAGGQVIVSTAYEPSGDVVFRVRDTGVGMTPAEIEQALKPFKQINALKRSRGDGTGLGLPLTKAMVEANRARFTISSTPGEGTLVEIAFPTTRVLAG